MANEISPKAERHQPHWRA